MTVLRDACFLRQNSVARPCGWLYRAMLGKADFRAGGFACSMFGGFMPRSVLQLSLLPLDTHLDLRGGWSSGSRCSVCLILLGFDVQDLAVITDAIRMLKLQCLIILISIH